MGKHLDLVHKKDLSAFRKIAIGTWKTAYDPSVYGTMEIRMDRAMDYIERFREATGRHLTVTHLVARAVAQALVRMPDANAILRFNRVYLRQRIGVFMQVAMTDEGEDKIDLSGVTIYEPEKMTLSQIVDEVEEKVGQVRKRKDPALEKSRNMIHKIPSVLLNLWMWILGLIIYTFNRDMSGAGIPQDPFGSVMITNIGSLGLDVAYVPLVPYSRVPILLAMGAVKEMPLVVDGEILPAQMMKISATFDHRFIDGFHASVMARTVRRWLEDPDEYFGAIEGGRAEEEAEG